MTRVVVPWPNKCLRTAAADVVEITDDLRVLWEDMIEVMEDMPGVGLAATQLGEMVRLAVVDASEARGKVIRMANPEILYSSAKLEKGYEASPNLPGVGADIERPRGVTVRFMDEHGDTIEQDFVGLWARSVQHQIDHLNGKMYFDNLSKLKRQMLVKKARKA